MLSNILKKNLQKSKYILTTLLLIALWNIMSKMYLIYNKQKKEGFESYTTCIKQGYSKKFCLQVPVEACVNNCNFKKWNPKY